MTNPRILIVEDENIIQMNIQRMLHRRGYAVAGTASSGEEAIVMAGDLSPDLILMDIILDGKMDGIDTVKKIQSKHDIPIIYLTAHSDEKTLNRAKETEPHGYILKPINHDELTSAIEIALYKHEMECKLKKNEDELNTAIAQYHSTIEALNDAMHVIDSDYNILIANRKLVNWNRDFGLETDLINRSLFDIYPFLEEKVREEYESVFNTGEMLITEEETHFNDKTVITQTSKIPVKRNGAIHQVITVMRDITELKMAEKALRESEGKFRNIVENSTNFFYSHTVDHQLTYLSPQIKNILGYEPEEAMVKWTTLTTDNPINEEGYKLTVKAIETGTRQHPYELELLTRDGRKVWIEIHESPVLEQGKTVAIVGAATDITDRKKAMEKLEASLEEKEILLKEIHHRVNNNMQIITSLLNLQAASISDENMLSLFQETENRINSMALIHEKVYRSDKLSEINFREYIQEFTDELASAYIHSESNYELKLELEDIHLDIDRAIPCALIINELFTNAVKHAFTGTGSGVISIGFHKDEKKGYCLEVHDNGRGLPDTIDIAHSNTLGLKLVYSLVRQLKGDIEIFKEKGTRFVITFQ